MMRCHKSQLGAAVLLLAATIALAATTPAAAQNLLQNPGCESGSLAPWVDEKGGKWECCNRAACSGGSDGARAGQYVMYAGDCSGPDCASVNNPLFHELAQVVDISQFSASVDGGSQKFALSGAVRTYCGIDSAEVQVETLDGAGSVLSTAKTCAYQDTAWGSFTLLLTPPVGARSIKVTAISSARGGQNSDGYFDAFVLQNCTTGCPTALPLVCPSMVTGVVSGTLLPQVLKDCGAALTSSVAAGLVLPTARATGYCTESCAKTWSTFKAAVQGGKDPDCAEFPIVQALLTQQITAVDRMCRNPVSDSFDYTRDNAAAGSQFSLTQAMWSLLLAAMVAAMSL